MVRTGFKRDVGRGATCGIPRFRERMNFGVRRAGALMPAFTDDTAVLDDDAADARVGRSGEQTARRELQRVRHMDVIGCGVGVGTQGG